MSSGTRVQPTPVGALEDRSTVHQGRREGALCRHFQALVKRPFGVLPIYVAGRLPALPACVPHPCGNAVSAVSRGRSGGLQRADEMVTVRAVKVTHVSHFMAQTVTSASATLWIVTSNFPHEIKGVTAVTRDSSDSLRARTRRASDESHVTNVLSNLTSDVGTRDLTYQFHCGRTHPRSNSTKLMSLASLG